MRKIVFIVFIIFLTVILVFVFRENMGHMYGLGKLISSNKSSVPSSFEASLSDAKGQNITVNVVHNEQVPQSIPLENQPVIQQLPAPEIIVPESTQDQIDDILEKIDILKRQIADLQPVLPADTSQNQSDDAVKLAEQQIPPPTILPKKNVPKINNSGGGSVKPIYPNMLISEVQLAGASDTKQEFVELYNPSDQYVDLTSWYVQRKTKSASSYASFAPNTLFAGKGIGPGSYFLIARQGYFIDLADIFTDNPLTQDNSLVLKNPNGDASDIVGFGLAEDFESSPGQNPGAGQSIGRKIGEEDTNNNLADFEIDTPSPKSANVTYVAPATPIIQPLPEISALKNIVINEIQTAGTTTKDEFIELYNPNTADIDLNGFSLKKKTFSDKHPEGTESNLVSADSFLGTIKALGYFLIVPKIDSDGTKNYTGLAKPDLYYSGGSGGFAVASNNTVLLYDKTKALLDKVGFGQSQDFETAPAQNPPTGKSIGRIKNTDGQIQDTGNNAVDFQVQDAVFDGKDTVAPQISNMVVSNISQESAVIIWGTNEASTSFVEYGQDVLYGVSVPLDATLLVSHTMSLSGLLPNMLYHYRVTSKDATGNEAISDDQTFTTLLPVDMAPPIRSHGLPEEQLPSGTEHTKMSVATDESATCKYAPTPDQGYDQMTDVLLTTDGLLHAVTIEGLNDGNSYTYYLKCTDILGNENTDDFVITFSIALPAPPPELPPEPESLPLPEPPPNS